MSRALPSGSGARGHFRLRYNVADSKGAITLRWAGRLHHLKVGAVHARWRVLAIVDEQEVTVVALDTGENLSTDVSRWLAAFGARVYAGAALQTVGRMKLGDAWRSALR